MKFQALAPIVLIAAPAPAQQAQPERIDVALSNFKFEPSTIRMKPGHAYVLHLSSSGGHSFEAKAFFAAARIPEADRAKIAKGKIELGAEASVDIHLTAPGPGTYPVHCTHFLHTTFGMTGKIVVG